MNQEYVDTVSITVGDSSRRVPSDEDAGQMCSIGFDQLPKQELDKAQPTTILAKGLRLLGHNLTVFPNVNRCSVHTRHFSGSARSTSHPTADAGSKALWLLWRLTSSGQGPRSSNLGLDSEFSYIAQ